MTDINKADEEARDAERRAASAGLPNRNAALPKGALKDTHQLVQGDEHRDPDRLPATPPGLTDIKDTVADHLRDTAAKD